MVLFFVYNQLEKIFKMKKPITKSDVMNVFGFEIFKVLNKCIWKTAVFIDYMTSKKFENKIIDFAQNLICFLFSKMVLK